MDTQIPNKRKTNFVLIHGASHGAWCWERVVPLLDADHRVGTVIAVDLPGHGLLLDVKPLTEISLDDYIDHVAGLIESLDLTDVVLVGHSLAGLTLPPVAHRVEARLRRLVYLASSHPAKGCSMFDLMRHELSPIQRGVTPETMFCNDLDEETSRWLLSQLVEEPMRPIHVPVEIPRGPASVPSTYVLLEKDETFPPGFQREQAQTAGADELVSFDSGHSAFASKPRELADLLLRYA